VLLQQRLSTAYSQKPRVCGCCSCIYSCFHGLLSVWTNGNSAASLAQVKRRAAAASRARICAQANVTWTETRDHDSDKQVAKYSAIGRTNTRHDSSLSAGVRLELFNARNILLLAFPRRGANAAPAIAVNPFVGFRFNAPDRVENADESCGMAERIFQQKEVPFFVRFRVLLFILTPVTSIFPAPKGQRENARNMRRSFMRQIF